ncbi:MAG TPA: hypothetical protein VIJ75_06610 [Hanamia sp.]
MATFKNTMHFVLKERTKKNAELVSAENKNSCYLFVYCNWFPITKAVIGAIANNNIASFYLIKYF